MNYRHAFHAGNHTEILKHSVLTFIMRSLLKKNNPFMVLDTHAGLGVYNLNSVESLKTGEKDAGVGRIFSKLLESAPEYSKIIHAMNETKLDMYPGSPEIIRGFLRDEDKLVACELHPKDYLQLKARYKHDPRVLTHQRDGYEAIGAFVPPKERRGLVFIDPPFESKEEVDYILAALKVAMAKWPTGIYCVWYPIKDRVISDQLSQWVSDALCPKTLRVEFCPYQVDCENLAGGGLIIINAPWKLDDASRALCLELTGLLGKRRGTWSVEWLTPQ